ncbi:MAG: hypothetical protein K9J30_08890 [Bacteroidales bacterium]|nr:hypothetical protein [Bacteroidales bacterium]
MKTIFNRLLLVALLPVLLAMASCFSEPATEPDATFTTNLTDNTAYAGESFYMYLDQAQGEFLTLFPGTSESKTYSPDDGTRAGTIISTSLDSFEVTLYNNMGTFPMTLVASSVGEFGDEYLQDIYAVELTVVDRRTGFISFQINQEEGVYNDDGTEIYFYTHDHADLSDIKPIFTLSSPDAVVTVNDEEQQSGKMSHDFTPDVAGSGESKTITYTVIAANGDSHDYGVKFILSEASSEKRLLSLTAVGWGGTKFTLTAEDENSKSVKLFYEPGSSLTKVKMKADAYANHVFATNDDGEQIDILPEDDRIDILNYPVVTTVAEDGTTQDYDLLLYELEALDTFNLVQAGGMALNPAVEGVIEGNTITCKVLSGTDLTTLVTKFGGLESSILKFDGVTLESEVTVVDLSGSPLVDVVHTDGTVLKSYTIVIEELE